MTDAFAYAIAIIPTLVSLLLLAYAGRLIHSAYLSKIASRPHRRLATSGLIAASAIVWLPLAGIFYALLMGLLYTVTGETQTP